MLAAIALLSAGAIAYELLLTRLFAITLWHHFAYMVISLALLGYGASGTFLVFTRRFLLPRFALSFSALAASFGVAAIGCYALVWRLPFNPLEIVWDWRQQLYLAAMYLSLMLPFFAAASAIGLALAARPAPIAVVYRADLAGAGAGAAAAVLAMFALPPEACLRLVGAGAFLSAALALMADGWRRLAFGAACLALPMALIWPTAWLKPVPSPYKALSLALNIPGTQVITERSSPLGRLSVIESHNVPLRHAPGLSLATTAAPPEQLGIFIDGEGMTAVTRFTGDVATLRFLDQQIAALPYHLLDRPVTLILGAGGGADVLMALFQQAQRIDAVELNGKLVDLVRADFGHFAGRIYDRSDVTLHIAEARSFVEASEARWNLIQLSLLDSFATSTAGLQAVSESPIYTIEAFKAYLDHLAPGGMLAITRWLGNPPRDSVKLLATAILALEAKGETRPAERLALLHSWNTAMLLVKNGFFVAGEIAALRRFASERQFDLAWYPGIGPEEANRYNRIPEPTLHDSAVALLGPGRSAFLDGYRFHIYPATDDRPFFFRSFKWTLLPELMTLRRQGGLVLIDQGYLVAVLGLPQAIVAALVLILVPLAALPRRESRSGNLSMLHVALYFLLLGLAFLLVEIAFIHSFSLFLGHPLTATAITLASFLVAAGLGSGISDRIAGRLGQTAIAWSAVAIVGLGATYALALPSLFAALMGLPLPAKIAVAAASIAPLGFAMGLPFPLGLSRLSREAPGLVPWAWGINGCASVIAAVLGTLLAMEFGFTGVVIFALGLYAVAAVVFGLWPREAPFQIGHGTLG